METLVNRASRLMQSSEISYRNKKGPCLSRR
jgi:hypothetical protein